jgi:hypothetical protein
MRRVVGGEQRGNAPNPAVKPDIAGKDTEA